MNQIKAFERKLEVLDKFYTLYNKSEQESIMSTSKNNERIPKEMVTNHALRILKKLDREKNVREEALSLIERADKKGILIKGNPKALAAGAVYIACILQEDRVTLDTIGGVVGLSGSTISKNYMTLARGLGFSER